MASQIKYQIFISSTFSDLVHERQELVKAILDIGHIPAGMEIFPAADEDQLMYIKKIIDECDYYILIIGGRYGSISQSGVSFTEDEFDYAVDSGKTVLVFPHADPSLLAVNKTDQDSVKQERLREFTVRACDGRLVKKWSDLNELKANAIVSLTRAISEKPGKGWVRGDALASSDMVEENNKLRRALDEKRDEVRKLIEESKPRIDNLAELSDVVEIRFETILRHDSEKRKSVVEMTWAEIIVACCPYFMKASAPTINSTYLTNWLTENRIDYKYFGYWSVQLFESDKVRIIAQLEALSYLTVYNANTVGGGVAAFGQLTRLGRQVLTGLLVDRRRHAVPS